MIRKSAKTIISLILASVLLLNGCALRPESASKDVDLDSFTRVSYDASEEYEEALEKYENGSDPAKIIRNDDSLEDKQIALVIQGTDDRVLVEKAIELLEDHKIKAGFAVNAITAAEDDRSVKLMASKGHEIIDNGLYANNPIELLSDEEVIYQISSSRKIFSTLLDITPDKLMLNGTYYTDSICQAAGACGYKKLVSPDPGDYLNEKSFKDEQKAREFIDRLPSGTILVYKLDGIIDALEMEPKIDYQKPAIDKQPTTDATAKEDEEEKTLTVFSWLLNAIDENNCKVVKLDTLKAMTDKEYIETLLAENNLNEADVYDQIETLEKIVGLSFYGLPKDEETTDRLIEDLKAQNANATFFVSAKELNENKDIAQKLAGQGFSFATTGDTGEDLFGNDTYEDCVQLRLGVRKLQKELSLKPRYYMPAGIVDSNLSKAVSVTGLSIVAPKKEISAQTGKINRIDIDDNFTEDSVTTFLSDAKKSGLEVVDVHTLVRSADSVPKIDDNTIKELREANDGKFAGKRDFIYTSERAMSFIFYGISNKVVLDDVLKILDSKGYKGTFFATQDELIGCKDQIFKILEEGHELGLAYIDREEENETQFEDVTTYILSAQKYAQWKYETDINLIFQPYGEVKDETREAVSATGCTLIGHEFSLVQSEFVDAADITEFYSGLVAKIDAHRGSISYFNMDYFTADKNLPEGSENTLLGSLLKRYISTKVAALTYKDVNGQAQYSTSYTVKTISALSHSGYVYYPGRSGSNRIFDNNSVLGGMASDVEQNNYMASRYIGNPDVTVIPGFPEEEMRKFDTSGKVGGGNLLFLTFDDWGYEKDINQLLYVLDKYGVKGNFFIRTNNVRNNPNLLRAIAVSGHMIGSHSDSHFVAWHSSDDGAGNYSYASLTPEETQAYRKDIVRSYSILNRYVGDVNIAGKPALSTIYRPPTLAVSREGMYQLFDVGYSYIVSGDFSTGDYEAGSLDALVSKLRNGEATWYGRAGVSGGSVLVMHMSPDAQYTAEALDIMIPEWIAAGYTIARLDDYLK